MTDLATDLENLFGMIKETEGILRQKDPNHELLRFAEARKKMGEGCEDLEPEFDERFRSQGETVMGAWAKYFIAVEEAVGIRTS